MVKYIITGLVALALIVGSVLTVFSRVQKSGVEFCPETFETRDFSYRVYRFGRPLASKINRDPPRRAGGSAYYQTSAARAA